jgi:hypothetical protein
MPGYGYGYGSGYPYDDGSGYPYNDGYYGGSPYYRRHSYHVRTSVTMSMPVPSGLKMYNNNRADIATTIVVIIRMLLRECTTNIEL